MEFSFCVRLNNFVVRLVVRRILLDLIGIRLRKISFEIGYGRRYFDELVFGELKGLLEVY